MALTSLPRVMIPTRAKNFQDQKWCNKNRPQKILKNRGKMVEAVGIEPAATCTENPEKTDSSLTPPNESAHICAQISGVECPHLAQVVSKWEDLPRSAREAISQLVSTFVKEDLR